MVSIRLRAGEEKLGKALPLPKSFKVWLKDTNMSITKAIKCLKCARSMLVMGGGSQRGRFTGRKGPDLYSGKAPGQVTGTSSLSHEERRESSEPFWPPLLVSRSSLVPPLETPLTKQSTAGY